MNLHQADQELLKLKGITAEKLEAQLKRIKEGFAYLKIEAPATPGHGISIPTPELEQRSIDIWHEYLAGGAKVVKMMPASGAASRMFKDIFAFINSRKEKPDSDFTKSFFENIEDFAFFPRLNLVCLQLYGMSVDTLLGEGRYKDVARALIEKEGLNYGQLPKALLQFHKVSGTSRTPFEEHLSEAAQYTRMADGTAAVHFTMSDEHLPLAQMKLEEVKGHLGHKYDTRFDVTFSVQKPSTDTIAANADGSPYRENGKLFFRPGGHGALIENLNELEGDIIFLKNIDNVVPDTKRDVTIRYKEVLGGIAVAVKQIIDRYCRQLLDTASLQPEQLDEMTSFLRKVLCVTNDNIEKMEITDKAAYLFSKFNRPLRVCGMVKNEGEPGGGPFLAYSPDGTVQPQILESTQIDPKDKKAREMLKNATHFNPVDIVVSLKDYDGRRFNLPDYVDHETGFISEKSREGVEIKALELPGLWNGAMSDWNTIFVEVPAATFNPVKTVNDLLRPAHQD